MRILIWMDSNWNSNLWNTEIWTVYIHTYSIYICVCVCVCVCVSINYIDSCVSQMHKNKLLHVWNIMMGSYTYTRLKKYIHIHYIYVIRKVCWLVPKRVLIPAYNPYRRSQSFDMISIYQLFLAFLNPYYL